MKDLEISGTITGKMLIKSRKKPTREETLKMANNFRFEDNFTGKINGFQFTKEELNPKTEQ